MNFFRIDFPFSPRKCPFFYGWIILGIATISTICSIPGQTMGVGVFIDYLIPALGLSRIQLSAAYMVGTISSSFLLPFAGNAIDRIGARKMVVIASIGLALSLVALALSERIIHLPKNESFLFVISVITLCFMAIRFFGQGCLTMVSKVVIGKWFNHKRGLATAISGVFVTFGFSVSPLLLDGMVQKFGWKGACLVLAAILGLGMSFLGWVFYRNNPEDCGLVMDGIDDPKWLKKKAEKIPETKKEFTRYEALRSWSFWVFSLATGTQSLVVTAVTFHLASLGAEVDLGRAEVYDLFLPMSLFGIIGNLTSGWVSDYLKLKFLLMVQMLFQAIGTTGLLNLGDSSGQWMFIVGYGISGGLFSTLTTVTWPRFFGRMHLGAISGFNMSVLVFASAIGPIIFSLTRKLTDTYFAVKVICLIFPLILAVGSIKADNPQEKVL